MEIGEIAFVRGDGLFNGVERAGALAGIGFAEEFHELNLELMYLGGLQWQLKKVGTLYRVLSGGSIFQALIADRGPLIRSLPDLNRLVQHMLSRRRWFTEN
jgi:hypothetical protein